MGQKFIVRISWIVAGFLALGTLFDAISNAISIVTFPIAIVGSALIGLTWVLAQLWLRSNPLKWTTNNTELKIKKLGWKVTLTMAGMVCLLWLPAIITSIGSTSEEIAPITPVVLTYQVHVLDSETNKPVSNAQIAMEVHNLKPLEAYTDLNGIARLAVASLYEGRPGSITIMADGYELRRQNMDMTLDALPDIILLKPESTATPIPTNTPIPKQPTIPPIDNSVKIVDILLHDVHRIGDTTSGGGNSIFPEIEIKLRNTGDQTAFIKRAEFVVHNVWRLDSAGIMCELDTVPFSEIYDVDFPIKTTVYTVTKNISQSIKPNEVDRFGFKLHIPTYDHEEKREDNPNIRPTSWLGVFVFYIDMRLIYNESDTYTQVEKLLFAAPKLPVGCGIMPRYSNSDEMLKEDINVLQNLTEIEAIKSPVVTALIKVATKECQFHGPDLKCGDELIWWGGIGL